MTLRQLRPDDFKTWRAARLANEQRMRPWWPAVDDWERAHDATGFVEHLQHWRRLARRREGLGLGIVVDGRVVGEIETYGMSPHGGTGESGIWASPDVGAAEVAGAVIIFVDYVFGVRGLRRLTAPVDVGNRYPVRLIRLVGFQEEGCLRQSRVVGGVPRDFLTFGMLAEDWPAARPRVQALVDRAGGGIGNRRIGERSVGGSSGQPADPGDGHDEGDTRLT